MDGHFKDYLSGQIRTFRREAKLTQEELGSQIGRTGEAVSNIERGISEPTLSTLVAIAEALNRPLGDMFPVGQFDGKQSLSRLRKEGELIAVLKNLTDSQLHVAIRQIRALGELDD